MFHKQATHRLRSLCNYLLQKRNTSGALVKPVKFSLAPSSAWSVVLKNQIYWYHAAINDKNPKQSAFSQQSYKSLVWLLVTIGKDGDEIVTADMRLTTMYISISEGKHVSMYSINLQSITSTFLAPETSTFLVFDKFPHTCSMSELSSYVIWVFRVRI